MPDSKTEGVEEEIRKPSRYTHTTCTAGRCIENVSSEEFRGVNEALGSTQLPITAAGAIHGAIRTYIRGPRRGH
jgi:hypothetical protein